MSAVAVALRVREATPAELAGWDDLVRRFANHRVVHTTPWIGSLEDSGLGTPLHLVLEQDGEVVGCLPGLLAGAGPWRLFGSPRVGWQCVSMGPAFDPDRVGTDEILGAVVPFLEQHHHVALIELMHQGLDPDTMRRHGFEGEPMPTYRAPLFPGDEARALRALKSSARRNIQRAERLGLEVRIETDERFVDEHYDQLREVYHYGGHSITFDRQRVLACFRRLRDSGQLVAASVYLPGGRVNIATGTFFIEGRELSLWMWAHRTHYRWYRPTELMTWTVMRQAMAAGCDTFDLMGRGEFKAKFGAELDDSRTRWVRSQRPWLSVARRLAVQVYRGQQAARGRVTRVFDAAGGRHRERPTPVCVIGNLQLVQTLGEAGVRPTVLAPPGNPARYSRFAEAALPWHDPWDHPERVVDTLLEYGARQPEPPILFYDEDRSALLVSRHRARLAQAFRFVAPEATLVEDLVDKGRFQKLARRLDLPVPDAVVLEPGTGLPDSTTIAWPAVVKPITRRPAIWSALGGSAKALRVASAAELARQWPRLASAGCALLVQSLIPGEEAHIESYHVYVDAAGAVAAEFTGRKLRTWPVDFGDSTALTLTDAADVVALGRDVVRKLKLRGVAKLDFKRAPDGRLYLLEVNPRFTLWHHLGARAGLNIPALVLADLAGGQRPAVHPPRPGATWCRPWADWHAALDTGVKVSSWLRWLRTCDALAGMGLNDPAPLLVAGAKRALARVRPRHTPAAMRERQPGYAW